MLRRVLFLILLSPFVFAKCKKTDISVADCIYPAVVPLQAYSYPVWHPNGQLIGFNYTPLSDIGTNGNPPCIWYSYAGKPDSTGFYIMNKNGTGFKRVTTYPLFAPAWSPNGNWLAFSLGSNIYKLRFTGTDFDTANIVQLTNSGGNFHPSWTVNSDTIYYDSNNLPSNGTGFYTIWKMDANGQSKIRIVDATGLGDIRMPYVATNDKIYYTRYISGKAEIFQMSKDGTSQQQYSNNGFDLKTPKYYQEKIFYEANQIGFINSIGLQGRKLISPAVTFDISTLGELVYSKMDYGLGFDKQKGTLWIINTDGTNNRQLTFNNF